MPSVESVYQSTTDFIHLKYILDQQVKETNAQKVVELGTNVGDSTRVFANALLGTGGKLLTIDIEPPVRNWHKEIPYPNVAFVTQDSLKVNFAEEIDLLFIDSDHHKNHVLSELRKYGIWVRVGGRILLHDITHSEYGKEITEAVNEWSKEVGIKNWQAYNVQHGLGVIEVDHPLR